MVLQAPFRINGLAYNDSQSPPNIELSANLSKSVVRTAAGTEFWQAHGRRAFVLSVVTWFEMSKPVASCTIKGALRHD
jgi:hypothetical protein